MYVEMQRPGFVFFFSIVYLYILYCKFSSVGASFYFTFEYLFYMLMTSGKEYIEPPKTR